MENNKKKRSRIGTWLRRLFMGKTKELSFLEEEQIQSPLRTVVANFARNRLAMFGLVMLILIFLFVFIGPSIWPIDLSYQDNTQQNVPPGMNMLDIPEELEGNVKKISAGTTFAAGVSNDGKFYLWGYTKITDVIDLKNVPEEVRNAKLVDVAVGYDHIVVLDESGKLYVWGNDRLGQAIFPIDIDNANRLGEDLHIKQLAAAYQYSAAVTEDGNLYLWGNANMNDLKLRNRYQGNIEMVATNVNSYIALLKTGEVVYAGFETNAYSTIPEEAQSGVISIAATGSSCAALKEDGTLVFWGNLSNHERDIPEHEGKIIGIYGGRYHYTALLDTGKVISWGGNVHHQSEVPASLADETVEKVFVGFYQNYAFTADGKASTWGLGGYLCGTDHLGRDILTRIVNGGKTTMTVGAVAVIISLVIGVVMGGVSGYFGGTADLIIMRVSEVIGGLPFLPFALILSAIIGTRISVEQRMYLIMVVLGVLSWPSICRLVRAQIFAVREQEFVVAAKALGVREVVIVFKHILPNVVSVILVTATLDFATSMLTESTLSYLGFGIPLPAPTWGNMLTGANNSIVIQQYWWRWVFPALIFGICTICINLIGDGLRDAIDPKSSDR